MHNVSGSRRVVCEAKSPEELQKFLGEYLKEHQAMTEIEHPAYQLRLVIESHAQTGYWVVYTETVLKDNFGGEILQEQTLGHQQAVHEVSQARVQSDRI